MKYFDKLRQSVLLHWQEIFSHANREGLRNYFTYLVKRAKEILRWDEIFSEANRKHLINIGIAIALQLWIVLWKILQRLLKAILNRAIDFISFLRHLDLQTLKEVGTRVAKQRLPGLSAEMAYNATLALFPALLAIIAAIGLFDSLRETLFQLGSLLIQIVPDEVRLLIKSGVDEILASRNIGIFSFSFIGSLWLFSGVLTSAMAALDRIHRVPAGKVRPFWKAKLVSLGLTIGTVALLMIASALVLISDFVVDLIARQSCLLETIPNCPLEQMADCFFQEPVDNCVLQSQLLATWSRLRWPITLGIVSIAFAFIYHYGPSRRKRRIPIVPGAVLAALMWAGISNLFRLYVLHFGNYNKTYGTIGTFMILLLWLYLSSLVVLIGAQLNVTVGEKINGDFYKRKRRIYLASQEKMEPPKKLIPTDSGDSKEKRDID
ncbi:MAG: YihY/virulence factor BrkB family protein [Cyanobacteriota bacterium]|nr:YihY/virulence factor BrkB family protein [Cyanobacteriota bacterium]